MNTLRLATTPSALPVEEAASYIGASASYLQKCRIRGDGPPYLKLGKKVVYLRTDLDRWLEGRRRTSTSEA